MSQVKIVIHGEDEPQATVCAAYAAPNLPKNQGWITVKIGDCEITVHSLTTERADDLARAFAVAADMLRDSLIASEINAEDGVYMSQPMPSL